MRLEAAISAGRCRDASIISRLIECKARIDAKSRWGSSVLHFACVQADNDPEFAERLLAGQALQVDTLNNQNRTPLAEAVKYDHEKMAKALLIDNGANINVISTKGETPIMEAVIHNSGRCLVLLFKENAKHQGSNGRKNTLSHLATFSGRIPTIEILTRKKLEEIDKDSENIDGKTAKSIAEERGEGGDWRVHSI